MGRLFLNLVPIENRFPDHPYLGQLIWCEISFLEEKKNDFNVVILNIDWEINHFIDWFLDSYHVFSTKEIELPKLKRESLAEVESRYNKYIKLLYDFEIDDSREFTIEEEEKSELEGKCIVYIGDKFGLERVLIEPFSIVNDFPNFIIGINDGIGEISFVDENSGLSWKYNFDMETFVKDTLFEIKNAIMEAKKYFFNPKIANLYDEYLSKINEHIELNNFEEPMKM